MILHGWVPATISPAEKFNRLSMVHERHRRQTTDTTAVPLAEHNVVTFGRYETYRRCEVMDL